MSAWEIVEDDLGYDETFEVRYKDETIVDLTGYAPYVDVWSGEYPNRTILATLTGALDPDPTTGRFTVTVTAALTATPGNYYFHVRLTVGVAPVTKRIQSDTYTVRVVEGAS